MSERRLSKEVCANCGLPVGYWYYGYKHQTGGNSTRRACDNIDPIPRQQWPLVVNARRAGDRLHATQETTE